MNRHVKAYHLVAAAGAGALVTLAASRFIEPDTATMTRENAVAEQSAVSEASHYEGNAGVNSKLKEELRHKDRMITALALQSAMATGEQEKSERAAALLSAHERTAEALEQRLFDAPPNSGAAARLQSELDSIVASGSLGDVDVEVACASNLCRALLTASDADTANQGAETLSARISKNFGAMTVLHTGDAERSIFVGKTSDDIAPEPRQPVQDQDIELVEADATVAHSTHEPARGAGTAAREAKR